MKVKVLIREPKRCSEAGCDLPIKARGLCRKHYCRQRDQEIKRGVWEPGPCGNFGDSEGHRISAAMGGAVRAQDVEGLRAAGRIGARRLVENNPEARARIVRLGGEATSKDRERMREMGKKGSEARWGKRQVEQEPD